jgi:hypothetical protein
MQFQARTIVAVACLAIASAQAAPPSRSAAAEAFDVAQHDFDQFVQHQLSARANAGVDGLPLDVADLNELKRARVVYGFPIYTVNPQALVAGTRAMQGLTEATEQFRFVIAAGGRAIGMATVEKHNGHYETVAYGAAVLAKDVDTLMTRHGNADKSNLRFVRVYQAQSDLLEVKDAHDGRVRYAPLHSARESLRMAAPGDDLVEEADILQPLRAAVKANLDATH